MVDKNILFIITGLGIGGAELLIAETVLELKKEYKSVHLLFLKDCKSLLDNEKYKNLNPIYLNINKNGFFRVIKIIRNYIKENNITTVHSHLSLANVITKISSLGFRKVKFYNTYHNMDERLRKKSISVLLYNFIDRFFINNFKNHTSIAISESVKKYHCDIVKLKPNKIITIYNGIFTNGQNIRSTKGFSDLNKILTIGRLEPVKNIEEQINALKELHLMGFENVSLTIVGDGSRRKYLEKLTNDLGLSKSVFFMGSRLDISNILPDYDIFVSSSIVEGFGLTILEAISFGLPVVATNNPAVVEVLDNGKYGLLYKSGDIFSLTGLLKKLLNNELDVSTMTNNAYKYFESQFTFDKYITRIKKLDE